MNRKATNARMPKEMREMGNEEIMTYEYNNA